MKVTVTPEENAKGILYPCLKTNGDGDIIILFTDKDTGLCLKHCVSSVVGDICDDWEEEEFKPFHGSITLSND